MLPDEIFVHRNLGNILSNGDLSSESAVEWCVGLLKVCSCLLCTLRCEGDFWNREENTARKWRE